ncbi:DNA-processing protein DprA [Scopulibacillus cellulosilyticus]|uniref:DNA-processing protein DprA n=1 Tax=Scopulibacillus cellulosilyticus TaxID=2665665 RepID=A0ABW2PW11_9BACL
MLTYDDPKYIKQAKKVSRSPVVLYFRGKLPDQLGIAAVGARRCTQEAKLAAVQLGEQLAANKIPLISGMAKGIDGYAQTACLKQGGYSLAVLAGGLDKCYPSEHQGLFQALIEQGGVLSAYPPETPHKSKQFIERNALIAAWSKQVIVVQASLKSGALTTADFAIQQGRELYAAPHSIFVKEAQGSNQLLEKRAKIYLGLDSIGLKSEKERNISDVKNGDGSLSEIQKKILTILKENPAEKAKLPLVLNLPEKTILEEIMLLELDGYL